MGDGLKRAFAATHRVKLTDKQISAMIALSDGEWHNPKTDRLNVNSLNGLWLKNLVIPEGVDGGNWNRWKLSLDGKDWVKRELL